jgi:VWFA-related protein
VGARFFAVLLILAAATHASAQRDAQPAQPAPEPARPTKIIAIVTDRQGRPVNGLTAKDFDVRDDDVVQQLESVEPRSAQPRRLAILLDEFHVADTDAQRVRDALTTFVDEELRPDDLVVVLKPLDSLPAIRLTSDRDAIRRAIATFEGRAGNYEPRSALEEQTVGRSPALAKSARAQIVLSALRALSARLGSGAGRPAIVLVSEGFAAEPRAIAVRALPDLAIVERSANRYDVPVYPIDPRDLEVPPLTADGPDATLRRLATQTGGFFSFGGVIAPSHASPPIFTALKQISRELDSGYLLTYRPAHGEDGKYHGVDVRVRRRDTDVRTRAGYVAPPSPEMRRAMRAALAPLSSEETRALRRSPLIDVWSGIARAADARGRVVVTWEPGRSLTAGKSRVASVSLKATTKDGTLLFDGALAAVRSPLESVGLPADRAEFDAPAGRVLLNMTILGERGEKLDEDARDLDVPALKGPGTLLLPPLLLATQSAREFREVTADENAVPAPSRQFRRTERLLVRVPAYQPGGNGAQVTVRLLNRIGQVMRELDRVPGVDVPGVTQFDLPLAPLAPGEYFLQLTATGAGAPAEQRISFTITG